MDKETKFRSALELNQDRIYRICCCYIRDAEERQDVYQQVLMHIWENLDSFQGRAQVSTWIYRITINTCFSALRTGMRKKQLFPAITLQHQEELADPECHENQYIVQNDVRSLYECINRLDPLDKALISLDLEDVRTKEMAEILGISEINVRVKLHRIKKRLKELLESNGYES